MGVREGERDGCGIWQTDISFFSSRSVFTFVSFVTRAISFPSRKLIREREEVIEES
jgi:hypothetical protein